MTLKDLRSVYKGIIAIFNYNEEPIYNQFEKKYPIEYLDDKEVLVVIPSKDLIKVKLLV